jgi:acyl-coenzyme A thioesterase PaaI-like protein
MFNSASNSIAYEILMLESVLHRPLSRVERRDEAYDQAESILSVQYFPAGSTSSASGEAVLRPSCKELTVPEDDSAARPLPTHTSTCMGCGTENASGLHIQPFRSGDEVFADVTFDERHIGGPGLAHGGAIAAACDEVLGFLVWVIGTPAVTRALTIDYLNPVPLGEAHRISARVDEEKGRAVHVSARGISGDTVRFTAHGVYVKVPFEHFDGFGALEDPVGDVQQKLARESGIG